MINRIDQVFKKKKKILSIYFTAGFPNLNDTPKIIENLQNSGVDIIEIGLPFSDPLADGPTIQESSTSALKNGMNTSLLFKQIKNHNALLNNLTFFNIHPLNIYQIQDNVILNVKY